MADLLTPIVLDFPDRGSCAIDYIDYFDEGLYGPDKMHFIGRFKGSEIFKDIATQIKTCLSLQNNPNSMIHLNRTCVPNKWMDPLTSKTDDYPQRAQYKIRFMLRIKFYGEYAYIDLGSSWKKDDDLTQPIEVLAKKDDGTLDAETLRNNLGIVNTSCISYKDAYVILNALYAAGLSYDGTTVYNPDSGQAEPMSAEALAAKEQAKAEANATYLSDGNDILSDDDGPITL